VRVLCASHAAVRFDLYFADDLRCARIVGDRHPIGQHASAVARGPCAYEGRWVNRDNRDDETKAYEVCCGTCNAWMLALSRE
jgi:hypothetical protein